MGWDSGEFANLGEFPWFKGGLSWRFGVWWFAFVFYLFRVEIANFCFWYFGCLGVLLV